MGVVKTEVILNKLTGVPADQVVNTFVFRTPATAIATADLDNIKTALSGFYNNVAGGNTLSSRLSNALDVAANHSQMRHYDISAHLTGTPAGSPLRIDSWTLGAVGSGALPDELACCLSYHADYTTDVEFGTGTRPRGRDRGRVFLGPLSSSTTFATTTTNQITVNAATRTTIAAAGAALMATSTVTWMQWSRVKGTVFPVVGGWVDDAYDVQRRRGIKPSVRTTF